MGKKARKAREKRKRALSLEKLRQDLFPKSILAQKAPRLDSVFLFWKMGNARLRKLSPSTLIKVFSKEIDRFGKKTFNQCKKIADSTREALITIARDRDELAAWSIEADPSALRDLWVDAIKHEVGKISAKLDSVPSGTVVERFLAQLPDEEPEADSVHPRGAQETAAPPKAERLDDSDSESIVTSVSVGKYNNN